MPAPVSDSGIRVLVVDDDASIRDVVSSHLRGLGHEVFLATTGEEGLELAKQRIPDLIMLDVVLPKLNGWDVVRKLRRDPETADIKVLMMSGVGDEILSNSLEVLGGDAAIDKPFRLDELDAALATLLK